MVDGGQAGAGAAPVPWWRRAVAGVAAGRRARRVRRETAAALYRGIVARARDPGFYAELGVPDTREGQLEMVILHAILAVRRLQAEALEGRELAQALFDLMFDDVDRHMREWGVSDLSVGKHVKRVAQTFYARAGAVEQALQAGDTEALLPVLARNVYGRDEAVGDAATLRLARYLVAQAAALAPQPGADVLAGRIAWSPDIPPAGEADGAHPQRDPDVRAAGAH